MGKLCLIIILFMMVRSQQSESYFKGQIVYTVNYEGFNGYDVSNFKTMYGDTIRLTYEDGKQELKFNGSANDFHVYDLRKATREMKLPGKAKLVVTDLKKPNSYIVDLKQNQTVSEILGYNVKKLDLSTQFIGMNMVMKQEIYYTDAIKINTSVYAQCFYNAMNTIAAITESIPLKRVIVYENYKVEHVAVRVIHNE